MIYYEAVIPLQDCIEMVTLTDCSQIKLSSKPSESAMIRYNTATGEYTLSAMSAKQAKKYPIKGFSSLHSYLHNNKVSVYLFDQRYVAPGEKWSWLLFSAPSSDTTKDGDVLTVPVMVSYDLNVTSFTGILVYLRED